MEEDYYKVQEIHNIMVKIVAFLFLILAIFYFFMGAIGIGIGIIIFGVIEILIQCWFHYLFLLKLKGPMIIIEQNKAIIENLVKISQK